MNKVQAVDTRVKQLIIALGNALRSLRLYPAYNPIPMSSVDKVQEILTQILNSEAELHLKFTKRNCFFKDNPLKTSSDEANRIHTITKEIFDRGITSLIFFEGITREEILEFLSLLSKEPSEIQELGGASTVLKEKEVAHMLLNEIPKRVEFSESSTGKDLSKSALTTEQRILDMLSTVVLKEKFNEKEKRLLLHLLSKPDDLTLVLNHLSLGDVKGGPANLRLLEKAVIKLSHSIKKKFDNDSGLAQNLINSILSMDKDLFNMLIVYLLFSGIRNEDAQRVIENIPLNKLLEGIMEAHETGQTQIQRLAPVISRLKLNSETKSQLIMALRNELITKGYSNEEVDLMFRPVSEEVPVADKRDGELDLGKKRSVEGEKGDSALPVIPMAESQFSPREMQILELLKSETNEKKYIEHVSSSLFTLFELSKDESIFENLVDAIKQHLPAAVRTGNFSALARAVSNLKEIGQNASSSKAGILIEDVLEEISQKKYIMQAFEAMSQVEMKTSQYKHALQFLKVLPREKTLNTLIEVLAIEELISRRKQLLMVISKISENSLHILGKWIEDPRWYLVRNIVTIFAITGKEESFRYLAKTIKHHDFRVKKESVKALGIIGGRQAFEILTEALSDDSKDLKHIIIRSIGQTGEPGSIEILRPIALKKDIFWRNLETRLAAIESLRKLNIPEAVEILKSLSRSRSFFFPHKARQLANAAREALSSLSGSKKREEPALVEMVDNA